MVSRGACLPLSGPERPAAAWVPPSSSSGPSSGTGKWRLRLNVRWPSLVTRTAACTGSRVRSPPTVYESLGKTSAAEKAAKREARDNG